ncbi:unnamed protein product, partial [Choristocarpus tenellus]
MAGPRGKQTAGPMPGITPGTSLFGPQAERSSQWVNRPGEANVPLQREALVVDAIVDKRLYEQEMSRMRAENNFLEDQVRRLSKELRQYQLRHPYSSGTRVATGA